MVGAQVFRQRLADDGVTEVCRTQYNARVTVINGGATQQDGSEDVR